MSRIQEAKKRAAIASVQLVESGHVVGLGTGSTANYMIEELGRRIREERVRIVGVPTSIQTAMMAEKHGIPLMTLDEYPHLDIAIDGADQVDSNLNLIKGMGGALTREKIVDGAAETLVVIVDESKVTSFLGSNQVVPVEVIPFAITPVLDEFATLGGTASVRTLNDCRFITDNGNIIIDVDFGPISDAKQLEKDIKMISGVVDSGLFVDMAKIAFIGSGSGVKKMEKKRG